MYVIHTTQLSDVDGQSYEIGDPRTLYYNNYLSPIYTLENGRFTPEDRVSLDPLKDLSETESFGVTRLSGLGSYGQGAVTRRYNIPFATAQNVVSGGRDILRYYYPTDETMGSGSKENFIAPSFRIASSLGKVMQGFRIEARRRCAVYQEAGRPAGRWRLPTKAEIKYIARLSADGRIPILLGDNDDPTKFGNYWSANGALQVNGVGVVRDVVAKENEEYAPRCVYDEWYWTKIDGGEFPVDPTTGKRLYPLTTVFYWGDVKKDNTQVLPTN